MIPAPAEAMTLIPADDSGPVFRAPWEAQAFAIVIRLHAAGHFTWPEWAEQLGAEIKDAQRAGDPDLGQTYYRHWVAALEKLVLRKQLLLPVDLRVRQIELEAKPADHGQITRRGPLFVAERNPGPRNEH
jgi:nitrile hydratase accessory protein